MDRLKVTEMALGASLWAVATVSKFVLGKLCRKRKPPRWALEDLEANNPE